MWRPSKYEISQVSLIRFAHKFNEISEEIECLPNSEETYDNDGQRTVNVDLYITILFFAKV